jgi:hypothetical protein
MSNNPVATLYVYCRAGRIVSAAIAQVPPEPPMGWETLTRIPISNNGRPPWRAFTVRHGHEGQDFARRHWSGDVAGDPPDLAVPAGAGGGGHRGHRRPKLSSSEGVNVGDTITYNGRQYRVLAITGDGRRAFIRDLATRQAVEIDLSTLQSQKGTCRC